MNYTGYVVQTEIGGLYVGITNDLPRRLREHKAKGPLKGFRLTKIVVEDFPDQQSAALWEIEQIAARGGPDRLLNTSFGGFGGRRRVVTQAERDHLSRLAVDRQKTPEFRAAMSESCKAAWANPDARKRQSEAAKKSCADPKTKARRSEAQKKLWADPEVRAKRIAGITRNRRDPSKAEARKTAAIKMWEKRRKA